MTNQFNNSENMLHIAEIPYESGMVKFRYTRRMSDDNQSWIRHGLFVAYHENGALASEGNYNNGVEVGVWRDFYENGQLASEGSYVSGKEEGLWRFWSQDGKENEPVVYSNGQEIV